jgi:hypothetical protein
MSTVPETEYVAAEDLQPGDRIIYGNLVVEVAAWPVAADWREGGEHVTGVEVQCRDVSGNARLSLFRRRDQLFERITRVSDSAVGNDPARGSIRQPDPTDDIELCPQAKVPCAPNAFDMCRYCGRDLSGGVS